MQILDDDTLQLLQLYVHLSMMLREGLYIEVRTGITIYKCLNIREYHLFLILHVIGDAMGIVIIKLEDKACQIILFIQRFNQFLTDKRQLEIYVIGMRSLEIMQEGRQRQAVGIVILLVTINRQVYHGQESISIHLLFFANFAHSFITKAQVDTEATEASFRLDLIKSLALS